VVEGQGGSLHGQQGGAGPGHPVHLDGQEDLLSTALRPAREGHDVAAAVPCGIGWGWVGWGWDGVGWGLPGLAHLVQPQQVNREQPRDPLGTAGLLRAHVQPEGCDIITSVRGRRLGSSRLPWQQFRGIPITKVTYRI